MGKKLKQYQKKFQTETAYNKKHLKAKPKSFNVNTNTNFLNDKITKEGSQYVYLSVTLINSVFKTGYNCYPQVFLEECKGVDQEKKMPKYNIDEISSDSDRKYSDEED